MTTLFPISGLQAANEQALSGNGGDDAGAGQGGAVFDLSSRRRRAAEIDQVDLHAYVDACLEAGRRAHIEAMLASDPEAGLLAAAYRSLNINLHRLFDRDLPPLTASLEALSRELDRRLSARRQSGEFREAPIGRVDVETATGRLADAVHRAPLMSVVAIASFIALVGLAWPLVAGQPASCSDRVGALAKSVAKRSAIPELGERLAVTALLCSAGDLERAEQELTRLEYETRRFGR